jgi:hypothetical protein
LRTRPRRRRCGRVLVWQLHPEVIHSAAAVVLWTLAGGGGTRLERQVAAEPKVRFRQKTVLSGEARNAAPASIARSCSESPTRTTFAPAASAADSRRSICREPIIPAGKT